MTRNLSFWVDREVITVNLRFDSQVSHLRCEIVSICALTLSFTTFVIGHGSSVLCHLGVEICQFPTIDR